MTRYGVEVKLPYTVDAADVTEVLRFNYEMTRRKVPTLPDWDEKFVRYGPMGLDADGYPYRRWGWIANTNEDAG
jgi:hypothetical protein